MTNLGERDDLNSETVVVPQPSSIRYSLLDFYRKIRCDYYTSSWMETQRNKKLLKEARHLIESDSSKNPLVSVIVPTFNRSKLLIERAIPSVLNQTYGNFELLIVGDCCTDDTKQRIEQIDDKRIKFYNLPERGIYPEDPLFRWMVAGCIPRNKGLEIASGKWIACMDDDDEFSKDHIEILLSNALEKHYEMVYGQLSMEIKPGVWVNRGSYPLTRQNILHSAVLYRSELRFIKYNKQSWRYYYEDDWDLWDRMKRAGVKIGFINNVVGKHYLEGTHVKASIERLWEERKPKYKIF